MAEQIKCKHEESFEVEEGLWCPDCNSIIAIRCYECGGEGFTYEDDYESDWINFTHDFITCPDCRGTGWVSDPTWQ